MTNLSMKAKLGCGGKKINLQFYRKQRAVGSWFQIWWRSMEDTSNSPTNNWRWQFPGIKQRARQLLENGAEKEGYWTGDRFIKQVEYAAKIADFKYPKDDYTIVWLFDQSSCHRKFNEQALLAKNILVKDGGPRRVRDTVWGRRANHGDRSCKGQFCWRGISTRRVCVCRICEYFCRTTKIL